MDMTTNAPETGSGARSPRPSNVIPLLTTPRQSAPCTPAEMARVLRRLHRAGITRGFVLVAPSELARQPLIELPDGGNPAHQARWWSALCDLITTQTGLSVALVDAADGGPDAQRVLDGARDRKKMAVLEDVTRAERSALLEISRGVCTGDRELLTEAGVLDAPTCEPWQVQMAIRSQAASDLFASMAWSGVLAASA